MEILYYYLIISLSLGISTLFGILNPAAKIAKDYIKKDTIVHVSPIVSRLTWVVLVTFFAPVYLYFIITVKADELIELFAKSLAEKS